MDVQNSLLDFMPPENFPEEFIPNSGKLHPKKLSYNILKEAIIIPHQQLESCSWSEKNVEALKCMV